MGVPLLLTNPEMEGDRVSLVDPEGVRVPTVLSVGPGDDETVRLVHALALCVLVGRADTLVEADTEFSTEDDTLAELVLHPVTDDEIVAD